MFYSILFFMSIFFHFSIFAQTVGENLKQKDIIPHIPLDVSVLPKNTFRAYRPKNSISNDIFEFHTYADPQQSKFRVSLVGVNINTWLENPENFNVLEYLAQQFPVENLLDNLVAYNPKLEFNTPDVVFNALHTDIYSPYLKIITNRKSLPHYFSSVSNTVSFTRNYHIYGAAAQKFPYFGQPIEGGSREINLGILPGQLEEYQAKLPDTDIFLVAMINISPNWLEEGWYIFQVNRQKITILIYAFNRQGKLIGGTGIPQSLFYNGQRFVIEQAAYSRVWQPLISRRFYAWPSFKIVNTPIPDTDKKVPSIVLPDNEIPRINNQQRYILKSIKNLQEAEKNIDIQLFDANGRQIYKPCKLLKNTNKIFLAKREIIHKKQMIANASKQSKLFSFLPYTIKARNFNTDTADAKKAEKEKLSKDSAKKSVFLRRYYPSNEGDKLKSIFGDALSMMVRAPVSYTNELNITNVILPFEREVDPSRYHRQRKKYYSLKLSIKDFIKNYKKETRQIISSMKREQNDQLFWVDAYKKILVQNKLWTEDLEQNRKAWKSAFLKKSDIEIQLTEMHRQEKLAKIIPQSLDEFSARQREELRRKYTNKEEKLLLKITQTDTTVDELRTQCHLAVNSEEHKNKQSLLMKELSIIFEESDKLFDEYIKKMPKELDFSSEEPVLFSKEEMEKLQEIVKKNKIPEQAVIQIYQAKKSPVTKYQLKQEKKREAKHKKASYLLYYEGFMLGLSSSWHVKTSLEDRMIRL
ncbi:hypothetical protein SAMN02745150_01397 [Brevinema andersonii]|uniref:Uncharacterized protein n=1 Tax=Brevinema andersonii TaxID=34097 RepID=A0A1I1F902_BREAD|nr:hypothetical protein [Brevinema andersonii]SFB94178.1 hypothetical protein SAMN02745150_01397 [Brevinema andersonii]